MGIPFSVTSSDSNKNRVSLSFKDTRRTIPDSFQNKSVMSASMVAVSFSGARLYGPVPKTEPGCLRCRVFLLILRSRVPYLLKVLVYLLLTFNITQIVGNVIIPVV